MTFHCLCAKETSAWHLVYKLALFQIHCLFNFLTVPIWLTVKSLYFITGLKVKVLNISLSFAANNLTWTDHKTNRQVAKELKITPILDKLQEYKRNWIQHVNRMPRNRLPKVMKQYSPSGRRNHGRPLKRILDA